MQYGDEIALLRDGLSLRRVRSRTGRAINTLRKLRTLFVIWIMDTVSPIPNNSQVQPQSPIYPSPKWPQSPPMHTDATGWALMQPVEPHRHSEACRPFSGVMQPDNQMTRHHFQKSETYFEITLGRKSVGVYLGQRMWWTWDGWDTGNNQIGDHPNLKLKHHNCIGCRIFSYLCREFFEGIAVKIWDKKPIFVP
jgi:hypothetical protein